MYRLLTLTAILTACGTGGGGGGGDSSTERTAPNALSFASEGELPACSDSLKNVLVYVRDTAQFKYCDGAAWNAISIVGKDGTPGASGSNGTSGANCYDGLTDQNGDGKVDVADCRVAASDVSKTYNFSGNNTDLCTNGDTCYFVWGKLDVYKDGSKRLQTVFYNSFYGDGEEHKFAEWVIPASDTGTILRLIDDNVTRSGGVKLWARIAGPFDDVLNSISLVHDSNNNDTFDGPDSFVQTINSN